MKRKLYLRVLLIGLVSLVSLTAIALVAGPESRWSNVAIRLIPVVVIGQLVSLLRIAIAPKSMLASSGMRDPAKQKKQWLLLAVWIGFMAFFGAGSIFAAEVFAAPPRSDLLAFMISVGLIFFVGITVLLGVSAKLGLVRFKAANWVRRLFNIPDDYQPPL